jgi:hypothetical protein
VYFHESRREGPYTIYPLTKEQFDILTSFLTSPKSDIACPLPIHATKENRPRYDPYHATKYFHIYRNRYEQRLPVEYWWPENPSVRDYPEVEDHLWLQNHMYQVAVGRKLLDAAAVEAAKERLKKVSPSSPLWLGGFNDPRYR